MKRTIIIADDHPLTLSGISAFVSGLGYYVHSTFTNGVTALNNILVFKPDFAILDISMPGLSGLEVLEKVRAQNKGIKIVLYTMFNDTALFKKAKLLGVNGYVMKDFALDELNACLEKLCTHDQWFSPRLQDALIITPESTSEERVQSLSVAEKKIISLIAKGASNKQIAQQLFISVKTVENHRSNIIKKIGLPPGKNVLAVWSAKQVSL